MNQDPVKAQALTLSTPRLLLRELTPDDGPALFEILGDPENMRFYPRPYTREEVDGWIARQFERYREGSGLLALILRDSGSFVGDCGLIWQDVEDVQEPEIAYHVHLAHQGRGYATEAARAVRDYAFGTLGCDHVISMIRPENLASRRVAEKNGLAVDRTVFWHGYQHCVYQLRKETL
jgi:[ribosomal protein S5]-alanine N-acetyltransferase